MRKLLNTLYITTPEAYLALDGENIVVRKEKTELGRVPLHNIEGVLTFGHTGASPALMGACAERGIAITFLNQYGKFRAKVCGKSRGNVVLRKEQYRRSDDETASLEIARNMILGKVYNSRWVLERTIRDHGLRVDANHLERVSKTLKEALPSIRTCPDLATLRGYEGEAASRYFSCFNALILNQKSDFVFDGRNKRPPLDPVNAMLSFIYTLLAHDIASALEANGLDAYVGFLHRDRPGRISLALDVMEELRPVLADRLVITMINKRTVNRKDFVIKENEAVLMTDKGRKKILEAWQSRKQETITHPYLNEKIPWGLVPHVQSMLLARYLREDIDEYPTFMWK